MANNSCVVREINKKTKALAQFDKGYACSQSVFSAYAEDLGLDQETALKIAGPFGGGMGRKAETCGAVTGALMALGLKYGATDPEDKETKEKTYKLARQFLDRFEARHGSSRCKELLGWDISTPAGHEAAKYRRLFSTLCPKYVAAAAEILDDIFAESERREPGADS
jgi:C_GCAxxG_C_C family probable redox protein